MTFLQGLPVRPGSFEPREYQVRAAENLHNAKNGLLVMPTALGKTIVAALVAAAVLKDKPNAKILFLAPTKPLAAQQIKRLREILALPEEEFEVVTGENEPPERKRIYASKQVIAATPQTIRNDLKHGALSLKGFGLVVVDEAHRAVGDYAYGEVASKAIEAHAYLLGLTASPSSNREKIKEICENLAVKHIEIKSETDEDVVEFINKVNFEWRMIDLPQDVNKLKRELDALLVETVAPLQRMGLVQSGRSKRELLGMREKALQAAKRNPAMWQALSLQARALNLMHAIDLLEAQGVGALYAYIQSLHSRKVKSKAVESLAKDPRMKSIEEDAARMVAKGESNPKLEQLLKIVKESTDAGESVIVFSHYRETARQLSSALNSLKGVKAAMLVGRSGEGGMTQKEQIGLIEQFREKEHNVLVATSVGEEGLDIPTVDLIVFYEAVPSEVRAIQRRGRAGRAKVGRVIVLVAKGTKDEAFLWISRSKEKQMHEHLAKMQKKITTTKKEEEEKPRKPSFGDEPRDQRSMSDFM